LGSDIGQEPAVNSIYITRTLQLNEPASIDRLLGRISDQSKLDFTSHLRKLRAEVDKERCFNVEISVKNLSGRQVGHIDGSPPYTNRIRIRIETEDVRRETLNQALQNTLSICTQLSGEINTLWHKQGTFSLTASLGSDIIQGREVERTERGYSVEVFGDNIRVRNIENEDLDEAVQTLGQAWDN